MLINTTLFVRACSLRKKLWKDIIKKHISRISNSNTFNNRKNNLLKSKANEWSRLSKHNNQRNLSTSQGKITPRRKSSILVSEEENREFIATFPDIVKHLTDTSEISDIPEACQWYEHVLQQNVPNGSHFIAHMLIVIYKALENPNNLTPENIRLANILGWCAEMFQAHIIMVDDIIDGSETRRHAPCWYKRVGLSAMNDSQLIENSIFNVVKTYFSHLPICLPVMELIHSNTHKICLGQILDMMCLKDGRPNLETFTMKRYNSIVKYKTYPGFHLPWTLGMFLANKFDPELHRQVNKLLLVLVQMFQIQNDFSDCFGDPEETGKIGSDIQEGKCSWLAVVALQKATSSQKKVIEENYGKQDPDAVATIKNLYIELGLPNTYAKYKDDTYNLIKTHIHQTTKDLPHALFFKYINELKRRG